MNMGNGLAIIGVAYITRAAFDTSPGQRTATRGSNEGVMCLLRSKIGDPVVVLLHRSVLQRWLHQQGMDDELGLDDGNTSESSPFSDDADSKEGTESDSSSSDEDEEDDESGRENRKPQRRRWSPLEERRFRVYMKKEWEWIATQFGWTEDGMKQHWRIMTSEGSQDRS